MTVFSLHKAVRLTFDLSGGYLGRCDKHTGIYPVLIASALSIVSTVPKEFHFSAFPNVLSASRYFP